jgi:hypothetical protein
MDEVMAWATFAGAWLLVARPLYQGSGPAEQEPRAHPGRRDAAGPAVRRLAPRAPWCTTLETSERRWPLGLMKKMLRSRGVMALQMWRLPGQDR